MMPFRTNVSYAVETELGTGRATPFGEISGFNDDNALSASAYAFRRRLWPSFAAPHYRHVALQYSTQIPRTLRKLEHGKMVQPSGTYRRLWQSDSDAIRSHMLRLPTDSRHSRFGMAVSDEFVERYTRHTSPLENVIFGFFDEQAILRGVGELRPLTPERLLGIGGEMEGAFSVEPPNQNQGIGGELMQLVIRAARVRCCTTLYLSFLTSNKPMRRLAMKNGARISTDQSESAGLIRPDMPDALAVWSEAFDNAKSIAIAALNIQRRGTPAVL